MRAVDPSSTRDYVPMCDRDLPAGEQTVFELKTLTPREERLLDNTLSLKGGEMALNLGDQYYLALCVGLVGVRNFTDASGKEVKVARETDMIHGFVRPLKEEFLAKIPKDVRGELAREIIENGGGDLTEEERKN